MPSKKVIREMQRLVELNERNLADHKADAAAKKHRGDAQEARAGEIHFLPYPP